MLDWRDVAWRLTRAHAVTGALNLYRGARKGVFRGLVAPVFGRVGIARRGSARVARVCRRGAVACEWDLSRDVDGLTRVRAALGVGRVRYAKVDAAWRRPAWRG